ncbi:tetratricopeptide repeat protein [Kribbella antibiotica]|uniref:tetratricopeptide repeat protein n=1 Tax=Kribbella antibiotica TaxID=190195 RepID=UPI001404E4CA|nr:NB-ARC domain-containing protein [Kribbella antibiotica]
MTDVASSATELRAAVLFSGAAGIGKTELAVQLALAVAEHFPGGQIFLRGVEPGSPRDLVGDLLGLMTGDRSDVVPVEVRIGTLRELLTRARVLVVVDDVRSEVEILPLLEIEGDFGLVMTSRSRMSGLADCGILGIAIERLSRASGSELIREIAPRLTESEAWDLVEACAGHPLAVRIAASRLASRPTLDAAQYISRLSSDDALDHLVAGQRTVTRVIEESYQSLGLDGATLISALGHLPPVPLPLEAVAAAMLGTVQVDDLDRTEVLLDLLFEQHLVEQPAAGVYQLHDLLHLFARARAKATRFAHSPLLEASKAYAVRIRSAHNKVAPSDESQDSVELGQRAVVVIDQDRQAALAIVELAAKRCVWDGVIDLVTALYPTLYLRGCWRDLRRASLCLSAAGKQADRAEWISAAEHHLAVAASQMGDFEAATDHFSRCEELALQSGDVVALQDAREAFGDLLLSQGRYADGIPLLKMSLSVWRLAKQSSRIASTLYRLGLTYLNVGDLRTAERYLVNGRQLAEKAGLGDGDLGFALGLSRLYRQSGRWLLSERECLAALASARRSGDRQIEAQVLLELGTARLRKESALDAGSCLEQALGLFRGMENRVAETKTLHALAMHRRLEGKPLEAAEYLDRSYSMAVELGLEAETAQCLAELGVIAADSGRPDADAIFTAAGCLAEGTGSTQLVAQIQYAHGLMLLRSARQADAVALLRSTWLLTRHETDSDIRVAIQVALGDALLQSGQYGAAAQALLPIAKAVSGTPGDGLKAGACRLLAVLYSRRELWAEADAALKEAFTLARERSDGGEELQCMATKANLCVRQGNWSEGIAAFDAAIEVAVRRADVRVLATLQANRWTTVWRSKQFGSHETALADCDKILDLAERGSMPWIRAGLLHNKGVYLAEAGRLDAAMKVFMEARALMLSSAQDADRVTIEMSLARTELHRGHLESASKHAADARMVAETHADWLAAASAVKMQLQICETAEESEQEVPIRARMDVSPRPEVLAALHAELAGQADLGSGDNVRGRTIRIGADVRAAMERLDIDIDSFLPWAQDSSQPCVVCGLSIASDGDAALIAATPQDRSVALVIRLAHATCSQSAMVNWTGQLAAESDTRFEIECALLGPAPSSVAGVVIDCYGGWGIGANGKIVDLMQTALRQFGFVDVRQERTLLEVEPRREAPAALLSGSQLRLDGIGDLALDLPLQFNRKWYRTASEQGSLLVMFGRNLPSMTWEDPTCLFRAAESGQLVATVAPLRLRQPGRNALCVCESGTALKFKRCCGAA